MPRAALIAFLLLAAPGFLSSQPQKTVLRQLTLQGNHRVSTRELVDLMSLKAGSSFTDAQISSDVSSILARYRREGYCFAEVTCGGPIDTPDSSAADLVILIREGEQLPIGPIDLEGNTAFTRDDILSGFETRAGQALDHAVLEGDIDRLISRYEASGYPFASVSVLAVEPFREDSSERLRVTLGVEEGRFMHIDEIRVSGNKETRDGVIIRETGIRAGETYDQEKIDRIRRRLNRLNIFTRVDDPEFYLRDTLGGLMVNVVEGNTNTFDGILGYVPASSDGTGGYLTGLIDVSMKNLFGTARKFNVHWQREDERTQEIRVRYIEPWVLDLPLDLSGGFEQREQDTIFVRRAAEVKAEVRLLEEFSLGGIFRQENVIPSATAASGAVSNSRTITTGLEINYDTRDDAMSPTAGVSYRSEYLIGTKKVYSGPPDERSTVQKVGLDAELYAQPLRRQVAALGLHGRQLTSGNIEQGDLFRFGGAATLRGYRENQFLGSRVAWTNLEYRFLLARRSFFFGFFDTGYYYLPGDDAKGVSSLQHLKYGYGIGIRLETALGNMGVSFALGEGDTFSQGKIHVGLINDF